MRPSSCARKQKSRNRPPARKKQHLSRPALTRQRQPSESRDSMADTTGEAYIVLNVVNINLLLAGAVGVVRVAVVAVLVELEADALVALVAVGVGLIDLCVLGQLAVCF